MAENMSVDMKEASREGSDDSMDSTPEAELGLSHQDSTSAVQKRKGGRKPVNPDTWSILALLHKTDACQIYATSEERKQRNRQAQAAFRERRTEYIKQLEDTIRAHETNLHNLQTAHRGAADECLMLRYKNSLLERILLEKGTPYRRVRVPSTLIRLQALMFRRSCAQRLAVRISAQVTCRRICSKRPRPGVPS